MVISGLKKIDTVVVPSKTYNDLVDNYTTHSLGGGEWSIEAHSDSMGIIKEWVGLNGTHPNEEADDLWGEVHQWQNSPEGGEATAIKGYSYEKYEAPDGVKGSYSFFMREARKGRLHGCLVIL